MDQQPELIPMVSAKAFPAVAYIDFDQIFFWQHKSFLWELKLELDPFGQETAASAQVLFMWKYYSAFFASFSSKEKIKYII